MSSLFKKLFPNHKPMTGRDHQEEHRAATMLELLYDLASVIAIASAATSFHHAINENHVGTGIISFFMTFFAIWWAWMNFTWFASAYDTDDTLYRGAVFIKICGALILAAGMEDAFMNMNFELSVIGYIIMRISLVSLWIRVARNCKNNKKSAYRYIFGITLVQICWYFMVHYTPKHYMILGFSALVFCELLVPYYAEKVANTKFHKHHIIERYGLLTIIVLGECFLGIVGALKHSLISLVHLYLFPFCAVHPLHFRFGGYILKM